MREFTEKHHAFISAAFYVLLTEKFNARGEAAFVHATQRYAEQRGARMAQRAIRDGKPLTFETYREYGEWVPTQSARNEGCANESCILSYAPDLTEKITMCPWAAQYKEMGLERAGTVYCAHLDVSLVRGFNPALLFEVPQSMHEREYCIQISHGANFKEGQTPKKRMEYVKDFEYHCAHIYKTYRDITAAIFGGEGRAVGEEVLARFGEKYGRDMAEAMAKHFGEDFDLAD